MTRLGAAFWLGLVLTSGFTTFSVKYAVQDIEDQLVRVKKQTVAEQQEIRVLTAEWTYLNQPERLAELNRQFLHLAPIGVKQMQHAIEDIALRAPAAPPDALVAAAPPAAPIPVAVAAAASAPTVTSAVRAARPAVAVRPAARVQLATAGMAPASLDALIAKIADTR